MPRNFEDLRLNVQTNNSLGSVGLDWSAFVAKFAPKIDNGFAYKLFLNGGAEESFQFVPGLMHVGDSSAGLRPAVAVEDGACEGPPLVRSPIALT
jgi:hypothetical protein